MLNEIDKSLQHTILESFSLAYVVIDKEKNVVLSNNLFDKHLSTNKDSKNYFFQLDVVERINDVFKTANESAMYLNVSKQKSYNLNFSPILSLNKNVEFVLCVVVEENNISNWQKEFNILFEKVPCYISVVDKNLKVIRANEKYRDTFGDQHSVFRTDLSRKKAIESNIAPVAVSFNENIEHMAYQVGQTKNGAKCHLIVNSIPLDKNLVMEITNDITELNQLQEQLHQAHNYYSELIERTSEGIIAIDDKGKVQIINESARNMLGVKTNRKPNINKIIELIPQDFFKEPDVTGAIVENKLIEVKNEEATINATISAYELVRKRSPIGRVAYLQDMSKINQLEKERNQAEDFAILTAFQALENNTKQMIERKGIDFDNFEKELSNPNKEEMMQAWKVFKFKNFISNDIISSFLDLTNGYDANFTNSNIKNIIDENIEMFAAWAKYDKIKFNYEVIGDLSNILSDGRLFRTLLMALISNSLQLAKSR